jgi:hypothetical protein
MKHDHFPALADKLKLKDEELKDLIVDEAYERKLENEKKRFAAANTAQIFHLTDKSSRELLKQYQEHFPAPGGSLDYQALSTATEIPPADIAGYFSGACDIEFMCLYNIAEALELPFEELLAHIYDEEYSYTLRNSADIYYFFRRKLQDNLLFYAAEVEELWSIVDAIGDDRYQKKAVEEYARKIFGNGEVPPPYSTLAGDSILRNKAQGLLRCLKYHPDDKHIAYYYAYMTCEIAKRKLYHLEYDDELASIVEDMARLLEKPSASVTDNYRITACKCLATVAEIIDICKDNEIKKSLDGLWIRAAEIFKQYWCDSFAAYVGVLEAAKMQASIDGEISYHQRIYGTGPSGTDGQNPSTRTKND